MDTRVSHSRLGRVAGLIAGIVAGVAAVVLAGTAVAHRIAEPTSAPFMEATHLPPLLTADGEPVELRYDVYCGDGSATDVDAPCDAEGSVFIRAGDSGAFREIGLREERGAAEGRYVAAVPERDRTVHVRVLVPRVLPERRDGSDDDRAGRGL